MSSNVLKIFSETEKVTAREFMEEIAIKSRMQPCPIKARFLGRDAYSVQEYLIPADIITKDQKSQARRSGKANQTIAELQPQLKQDGQSEGVCVELVPAKGGSHSFGTSFELVLRWGNHRLAAILSLANVGDSILGAPKGYVWVQMYNENYQPSDLNTVQCIENNLSKAKHLADQEQNIRHLRLQFDNCPNFMNLGEAEKRDVATKWIKSTMGSNVKQPKKLIDAWFEQNDDIKTDTKTQLECQKHFNDFAHRCGFPSTLQFDQASKRGNDLELDGVIYSLYISHQGKFENGAQRQRMSTKKFGLDGPKTDVIIQVVALNLSQLKNESAREKARQEYMKGVRHWNTKYADGRLVDYVLFVPQTEEEESMTHAEWRQQPYAFFDLTSEN